MRKRTAGISITEIMLAISCMLIVIFAFNALLKIWTTWSVTGMKGTRAMMASQTMSREFERGLYGANEINLASATAVGFIADISENPHFNWNGDIDNDGLLNKYDADFDNDASSIPAGGSAWRVGFNLRDDDENGDSKIDFQVRFYLLEDKLYKDYSIDEQPWGNHVEVIAKNVNSMVISYFGSKGLPTGATLDTGMDGNPSTTDSGQNDGIITQTEIDMTEPPTGSGNKNGWLDTPGEFARVTSFRIMVNFDIDHDGKIDYTFNTEASPPLLAVKPLQI